MTGEQARFGDRARPPVDGACVISLDEDGATTLRDMLTKWLGVDQG
jgi:hypothetical protein